MKELRVLLAPWLLLTWGCASWVVGPTDREVQRLVEQRQTEALGATQDAQIGTEQGDTGDRSNMYAFNPRPLEPGVPAAFSGPPREPTPVPSETTVEDPGAPSEQEGNSEALDDKVFTPDELARVQVFVLRDALRYAMRNARDMQNAKEDLYLAALDLSLERHLWTPQFVASIQANYTHFPDGNDPDRAMSAVSEAAVTQRLPFGGAVSARVIDSAMRQVSDLVTKGESGQAILSAQIPLLRGAGPTAYESRYQAERDLIYAVRRFERFRRSFLVDIAADYFGLQQLKAAITNTYIAYQNRRKDWEKAEFVHRMGRSRSIFEAPRAQSNLRDAESRLVSAKERYASALDRFKIRIGMNVEELLDVVEQETDKSAAAVDELLPEIDEGSAVETALHYRLDLVNDRDQVDDSRRGVEVAKNRILPDLDLTGGVTFDSNPDQLRAANLREERSTWEGSVQFRLDDRKTERNAYRASLIRLRRSERDHEQAIDNVKADVRRAIRRVAQQDNLRLIQTLNVRENERRREAASAQFELGKTTNQDLVDAETDLLNARNDLAAAVAEYRIAILEFRRDTGTLRIDDHGEWVRTGQQQPAPERPIDPDNGG